MGPPKEQFTVFSYKFAVLGVRKKKRYRRGTEFTEVCRGGKKGKEKCLTQTEQRGRRGNGELGEADEGVDESREKKRRGTVTPRPGRGRRRRREEGYQRSGSKKRLTERIQRAQSSQRRAKKRKA
jgi:hypothetical protein